MMVWQAHDRNEWAVSIDRALARGMRSPVADFGPDPFSLGEPAAARHILASAGFSAVAFTDVEVPVYYGRDVDAALDFVSRFGTVSQALRQSDPLTASVVADLRATLIAHASDGGVWLQSRAWIVTARRGDPSVVA